MKSLITAIFAIVISIPLHSQDIATKISTAFHAFENQSALSNSLVGFVALDSKNGQVLFEKNSEKGLATASTLKTITSATALDVLGSEYTYSTSLHYTGTVDKNGHLNGDIIIEGSGDPTLGSDRYPDTKAENLLNLWISEIKKAGIKSINGRIIGDDALFGGNAIPPTWLDGDIGNYYGAGVSGLNWKENKAGIVFTASQVGKPAGIARMTADLSYLKIDNQVTTGGNGTGDRVYGYSKPYATTIELKGTYGRDLKKTIEISVPDPAYLLARDLKNELKKQSILTEVELTTGKLLKDKGISFGKDKKLLITHTSPKLKDIVYWFNQKSINLYGEAMLNTIYLKIKGNYSQASRTDVLTDYWKQKLNLTPGQFNIKDGCGLSPENRVSVNAMSAVLQYAQYKTWYDTFYKSLPTINNMKMKSGTIGGVLGYAGYQRTSKGQDLTFVLFVNNYKGNTSAMRQQMFKLLNVLKQ